MSKTTIIIAGEQWRHRYILQPNPSVSGTEKFINRTINRPISGGAAALYEVIKTLKTLKDEKDGVLKNYFPDTEIYPSLFPRGASLDEHASLIQWFPQEVNHKNNQVLREVSYLGCQRPTDEPSLSSSGFELEKNFGKPDLLLLYQKSEIPSSLITLIKEKADAINAVFWMPLNYDFLREDNKSTYYDLIKATSKNSLDKPNLAEKTVVFLKTSRLMDCNIGNRDDLSLESCIGGLYSSFSNNEKLKVLLNCKAIVIYTGIDFAFVITPANSDNSNFHNDVHIDKYHIHVFFRSLRTCDYYRTDLGTLSGYSHLLLASCAKSYCAKSEGREDLEYLYEGVKDALERCKTFFKNGLTAPASNNEKKDKNSEISIEKLCKKIYPPRQDNEHVENLCQQVCAPGQDNNEKQEHIETLSQEVYALMQDKDEKHVERICDIVLKKLPPSVEHIDHWSLINEQISQPDVAGVSSNELSKSIVKFGLDSIINNRKRQEGEERENIKFPIAQIGKMTVVDPSEIENYRYIQSLIRRYGMCQWEKPLGLGVFGPPGGGKSFGVKEVAKAALNIEDTKELTLVECNLAQLTSPEELAHKLHEAQDKGLGSNSLPFVFLDEFDSIFDGKQFGWFKYLLPLLQDGVFKQGDSYYHLGKAVIICAGGMHRTFEELTTRQRDNSFIEAKGPDLLSRLRGHVNTLGPNRFDDHDKLFQIRRAVFLRKKLKEIMLFIFNLQMEANIAEPLLNAFLNVSEFRHGIRSIEAIIQMSVPPNGRSGKQYVSAWLPPYAQLNIHTPAREFLSLCK